MVEHQIEVYGTFPNSTNASVPGFLTSQNNNARAQLAAIHIYN